MIISSLAMIFNHSAMKTKKVKEKNLFVELDEFVKLNEFIEMISKII